MSGQKISFSPRVRGATLALLAVCLFSSTSLEAQEHQEDGKIGSWIIGGVVGAATGGLLLCPLAAGSDTGCGLWVGVGALAGIGIADAIDRANDPVNIESPAFRVSKNQCTPRLGEIARQNEVSRKPRPDTELLLNPSSDHARRHAVGQIFQGEHHVCDNKRVSSLRDRR